MFFSLPYVIFRLLSYVSECKFRHNLFTLQIFSSSSPILFLLSENRGEKPEHLNCEKSVLCQGKGTAQAREQGIGTAEQWSPCLHSFYLRSHLEFLNLHTCGEQRAAHLYFMKCHSAPVMVDGRLGIWRQANHCGRMYRVVHKAL